MRDFLKDSGVLVAAFLTFSVAGCHGGSRQETASEEQEPIADAPTQEIIPEQVAEVIPEQASAISPENVTVSATSFNPSLKEQVRLGYRLAQADQVTVRVYDSDGGLVRTLVDAAAREAGTHEESWNGRDDAYRVVPDEAYTFTIETAAGGVYDPTTVSGGVVDDIRDAQFDWEGGTVAYKLPAPARVLIRLGIRSGPMLKTLVDWRPRVAGTITEYWDGRDEDKLMSLREREGFSALITHVTLPDATVIAYGNDEETYRDYKLGRGQERPQKPERPRQEDSELRLRPTGLVPPAWSRAPKVSMTFPKHTETVPAARGEIAVRIDVDTSDKGLLLADQFEVIFFVDNVFFAEAERGHLPFNWPWELQQLPPGEHVLTVNISSFKGQVGVASRKMRVVAEE